MITRIEQEFYENLPYHLGRIANSLEKLVESKERQTGKTPVQLEPPVRDEHPRDSMFDYCLAVTKVEVFPKYNSSRKDLVLGLATVVLNDQLTLQGLTICESQETGTYVGYPTNNYFPITRQLREHIENCVLEMYNSMQSNSDN